MSEQAQFGFAFDVEENPPISKTVQEKPKAVDSLACPRCGGPSQKSIRPEEMGGERYCPVCQGEDGCFYFTPGVTVSPGQEIVREAFENVSNETLKEIDKELGIHVASNDEPIVYEEVKIPDHDILMLGCSATDIPLGNSSVQCIVTSPPYWGLRKYAGEQEVAWEDGTKHPYGLEPTVEMYIDHSIQILCELRRVLRNDGVAFWNLGDSYAGSTTIGSGGGSPKQQSERDAHFENDIRREFNGPVKPKDLCLIPQRLALAAQADGWWIRSWIIWHKPNPMPESCTDRPTDSYEHIIMMTKNAKYFWDQDAVAEDANPKYQSRYDYEFLTGEKEVSGSGRPDGASNTPGMKNYTGKRNLRNVWTFPTQPYSGAHFATFPEELPRRCILAATSEKGCCMKCGAPYERILEDSPAYKAIKEKNKARGNGEYESGGLEAGRLFTNNNPGHTRDQITLGWQKTCQCPGDEIKPCVVLDPFGGSGTTGKVAIELNRRAVLVDITYQKDGGYETLVEQRTKGVQRKLPCI